MSDQVTTEDFNPVQFILDNGTMNEAKTAINMTTKGYREFMKKEGISSKLLDTMHEANKKLYRAAVQVSQQGVKDYVQANPTTPLSEVSFKVQISGPHTTTQAITTGEVTTPKKARDAEGKLVETGEMISRPRTKVKHKERTAYIPEMTKEHLEALEKELKAFQK